MARWLFLFLLLSSSCSDSSSTVTQTFLVGGTISGLSGTVVLQNNSGDNLSLTAEGSFNFATKLVDGAAYAVTVLTQPDGQTCSISNSSGTIATADVANASIVCSSTTYTVGGTLTGLSGTVVLQNNAGDDLSLTEDGAFTFETAVADGAGYAVTISSQPSGLTCSASSGSGTLSGANITNVSIVCSAHTYTVGGTVTGLSGTVVLQNNGGDNLTRTTNASFTFATVVADGAAYEVTVKTPPSGASCSVANGTGTISGANVTNLTVTCAANTYIVGGTISGLSGTVVLQNNGGDNLSKTTNGSFTFSAALADGAGYAITVLTQPSLQTCSASGASGTIAASNVTSVSVTCSTLKRMWVTNNTKDGNIGGISGADTMCADVADANRPSSGTYKALIGMGTTRVACTSSSCAIAGTNEHTGWVLAASTTYVRSNGTTTIGTTTANGIFSFPLDAAWDGNSNFVWTGLDTAWVNSSNVCGSWNTADLFSHGAMGSTSSTSNTSLFTGENSPCEATRRILCVEQ